MSSDRPLLHAWPQEIIESDLSPREKIVGMAVAHHADSKGECYPSLKRLARCSSYSRSVVQLAIDALDERGWLDVQRGGLPKRLNVYRLTFPKGYEHTGVASSNGRVRREEVDLSVYN